MRTGKDFSCRSVCHVLFSSVILNIKKKSLNKTFWIFSKTKIVDFFLRKILSRDISAPVITFPVLLMQFKSMVVYFRCSGLWNLDDFFPRVILLSKIVQDVFISISYFISSFFICHELQFLLPDHFENLFKMKNSLAIKLDLFYISTCLVQFRQFRWYNLQRAAKHSARLRFKRDREAFRPQARTYP